MSSRLLMSSLLVLFVIIAVWALRPEQGRYEQPNPTTLGQPTSTR